MTNKDAMEILLDLGWNEDGAVEIIDAIEDLETMTMEQLVALSEDYSDR